MSSKKKIDTLNIEMLSKHEEVSREARGELSGLGKTLSGSGIGLSKVGGADKKEDGKNFLQRLETRQGTKARPAVDDSALRPEQYVFHGWQILSDAKKRRLAGWEQIALLPPCSMRCIYNPL